MLEVSGLACSRGDRSIFVDIDFSLSPGEWLHVEGENGAGKTSLLRIVAGLLAPVAGDIRWNGASVREARDDYNGRMLYLGHAPAIKEELTALENLSAAAAIAGEPRDEASLLAALRRVGLKARERLPVRHLSQGQKRRVALARLPVSRARLWILDEPFVALDVAAVKMLKGLLDGHLEGGGMVLLTSHQEFALAGRGRSLVLGPR